MRLLEIVETSRQVAATRARLEKIGQLAALLKRAGADDVGLAVAYLSGYTPVGRVGIGPATLRAAFPDTAVDCGELTLLEVERALRRMAELAGPGSNRERGRIVRALLARATREEQDFLTRLMLGELRQGALEGVMVEAIACAAELPAASVRRAAMFGGDLTEVAGTALAEGRAGLARFSVQLLRPVRPMLAASAEEVGAVLARFERAALEYKLDGARVQVHRAGGEVRIFTRQLRDVTASLPEVVETVRALPVREVILDGEALAFRADGKPRPFQVTMRRFGRRLELDRMQRELPLTTYFFDCLYLDGEDLVDRSTNERTKALAGSLPEPLVVPRTVTADPMEAETFLQEALAAGHEGIMAKALDAPYEAGRRGQTWLKLKPAHTLDLVVLAAEWGSGRRRGWLSNLHLGARDPAAGSFAMLGKTFKGMTDETLEWQTRKLQELEISRDAHTVYVKPELVVEIAFNDVQRSPRYPAGLALRFARVKRYRPDKRPEAADSIDSVRAIYERSATTAD